MKRKISIMTGLIIAVWILLPPSVTQAHVTVSPSEVSVSARQTFAVSVPNERDTAVIAVRLVIPSGLSSVRAHAKSGWNVDATTSGEGETVSTTEIVWTSNGANIPVKLKDEFLFSARAPAEPTDLIWKAYETYADGTVVAWDQDEDADRPASVTSVSEMSAVETALQSDESTDRALYVSITALFVAILAFTLSLRPKS